jgi:hypothetical protein
MSKLRKSQFSGHGIVVVGDDVVVVVVQAVAGRGLRMSLPVSSQSIAKSKRTSRLRLTRIEGATTRR